MLLTCKYILIDKAHIMWNMETNNVVIKTVYLISDDIEPVVVNV